MRSMTTSRISVVFHLQQPLYRRHRSGSNLASCAAEPEPTIELRALHEAWDRGPWFP
jgi:hypothetical protein